MEKLKDVLPQSKKSEKKTNPKKKSGSFSDIMKQTTTNKQPDVDDSKPAFDASTYVNSEEEVASPTVIAGDSQGEFVGILNRAQRKRLFKMAGIKRVEEVKIKSVWEVKAELKRRRKNRKKLRQTRR